MTCSSDGVERGQRRRSCCFGGADASGGSDFSTGSIWKNHPILTGPGQLAQEDQDDYYYLLLSRVRRDGSGRRVRGMICNDLGRITLVSCSARGQAIACRGSQYTIFSCAFVAILSVEQLKDIKLAVNALPLEQKFGRGEFAAGISPYGAGEHGRVRDGAYQIAAPAHFVGISFFLRESVATFCGFVSFSWMPYFSVRCPMSDIFFDTFFRRSISFSFALLFGNLLSFYITIFCFT